MDQLVVLFSKDPVTVSPATRELVVDLEHSNQLGECLEPRA